MKILLVFKNRVRILFALGLSFIAFNSGAQEPPLLTPQRYTEDYSYLADPENRSGAWWESFKWIPLDPRGAIRLNVGEDLLVDRQWHRNNPYSPTGEFTGESYWLVRTSPYADLHLGSRWRVFGQFVGAWTTRSAQAKSTAEETKVDLLQAFAEWRTPLGSQDSLELRVGRQVLYYGTGRLIAPGRFVRRSFDGGVAQLNLGSWRADVFLFRPVRVGLLPFDDKTDGTQALWSLYTTHDLPGLESISGIDFYYFGFENEKARYNFGEGNEHRHTLGARFFGESGLWRWDSEAMYQLGSFSGSDIRAWAVANSISYGDFELRANILSGDQNNGTLGTFNAMFPANRYFGYLNLIGPANLINLRPIATIQLAENWTLSPSAVFYWRQSLADGVYGPGLNLVEPSNEIEGRYLGTQGELVLGWAASRNLSLWAVYAAYEPKSGPLTQLFLLESIFEF